MQWKNVNFIHKSIYLYFLIIFSSASVMPSSWEAAYLVTYLQGIEEKHKCSHKEKFYWTIRILSANNFWIL